MFNDNKLLGNFRLDGIAPAPRGMPQIEVTFDIDANGILHVSAKDKQSGKEQKISIQGSSGLSKDEVERARKEAEAHAEEDRRRSEAVDTRNRAENLTYQVEKQLKELPENAPAELKQSIEEKVKAVREALKSEDDEAVKRTAAELEAQLSALYSAAQQAQQAAGGPAPEPADTGDATGDAGSSEPRQAKGKVVDAEVVD